MRILELKLSGGDIDGLRRFYSGVLGLREIASRDANQLTVQAGRSLLSFSQRVGPEQTRPPRYHFAFDVPSARFDAAYSWLQQRSGPIASPEGETRFSGSWNSDSVYFADPQGNILELIARHTLPADEHQPPIDGSRPFNTAEITGITELGVAVDSVVDGVGVLMARMPGLEIYSGAGSDTFTALGDHHGLLIVVRRGRIWFPETGVPAQFLPFDALIELEAGQRCRLSAPPFPFDVRASG